jgi:hypothetical protein
MKFEDALKRIKGAESVGGQLIVHRHGRNVLVGKNVQGTLIVEDDDEAKGYVLEVDKKGVEEGVLAELDADDKSILSTHPVEAALHPTQPMMHVDADDAITPADAGDDEYDDAETRTEATKPAKGADPNTPKPNTAETSGDKAGQEARETKQEARDADKAEGRTHDLKAEDRVDVKDKTGSKK